MTAREQILLSAAALALAAYALHAGAPVRAAGGACGGSAAYHALDFSIGTWSIMVPGTPSRATSTIHREAGGCAIVENWNGGGQTGINVDAYNTEDKRWHR